MNYQFLDPKTKTPVDLEKVKEHLATMVGEKMVEGWYYYLIVIATGALSHSGGFVLSLRSLRAQIKRIEKMLKKDGKEGWRPEEINVIETMLNKKYIVKAWR